MDDFKQFYVFLCLLVSMTTASAPQSHAETQVVEPYMAPYIDGVMEAAIARGDTVGAAVAVVQNGRLLLARGYGFANLAQQIPVQSRRTQFRIGSITKVLVWMSVLQQVEAGVLDLDADVNTYLKDFQLSNDLSDPITLRHLMTHTPGFDEDITYLFATGARQAGDLGEILVTRMPRRVWLPGVQTAYSNYGAALAGYIVGQVTGMDWHDYVERQILEPLGMIDATTRQPVPEAIEQTRARGYLKLGQRFEEQGFGFVPMYPAGSASATALDVARLMVELLNAQGTGVLSATSKAQLLNGAYKSHPGLNGMTLGLYEMSLGNVRAVGHDGGTGLFISKMVLWPELNMGLFVATNTDTGGLVTKNLMDTIAAHFGLSEDELELEPVASADAFAGNYVSNRRAFFGPTKLVGFSDTATVTYDRLQDYLVVSDMFGARRYQAAGDNLFKEKHGTAKVAFSKSIDGGFNLHFANRPMVTYTPTEWIDSLQASALFVGLFALACLSVVLIWPITAFVYRDRSVSSGQRVVTLLELLVIVLAVWFFWRLSGLSGGGVYEFLMMGVKQISSTLWAPLAISVVVVLQVIYVYRVWAGGYWWLSRRLHFTFVLLANCAFVWWLWHWHLVPEFAVQWLG